MDFSPGFARKNFCYKQYLKETVEETCVPLFIKWINVRFPMWYPLNLY